MIVRGRVVDEERRPVAGAEVLLVLEFAPIPAIGQTLEDWKRPFAATSGQAGEYAFTVEPERRQRQHARALLARHSSRVSQKLVVDWSDGTIAAPDLVLSQGVVGRVRVLWDDGPPAAGVSIGIMLSERATEGEDPRPRAQSVEGVTNERGELSVGPIADVEYERVAVRADHPDAPTRWPWWDGQRVSATDPIEISLFRGPIVRGRLLTADGQPAAGYRVTPWGGEIFGDPDVEQAVTTDAQGQFEVRGVDPQDGAIAVYEGAPRRDAGDLQARMRAAFARVTLGHPLLIREVPPGETDLGTVSIPALGTLTVRFEDAKGAPVRSGTAFWMRSSVHHGGRGHRPDADGIVRLESIPLGIGIVLRLLQFDDPQHGEMEQAFKIPEVREETITLRATGAGTVVFRLHPKGAPDRPLTVTHASFGEHECHGAARDGPLSEYHWWTQPGFYPSLEVTAKGFRKHVIENVTVRDDGPTFLDVELEPR